MNSEIAKERITAVARPDSITYSEGDFLATHVAVKKLELLDKFVLNPTGGKEYSEEDVFKQYVSNPSDIHQFIAVYGQSGTGKSHLIRWFAARYEQIKSSDEVVLFIRRSDNTLKGTIRQLLEKPEVQGMSNKEVYERLAKATVSVEENKLKDLIYHNFIIEIDNDFDEHDIKIGNVMKKKLVAFLNNDIVHDFLMKKNGPIERMYSKIAEHSLVVRDTVAEFKPTDFFVNQDLFEQIQSSGSDRKAKKMALELLSDEKGPKTAKEISNYLNQFRNDVIQRCAGIEPGDFKQIFFDIRKELYRMEKSLTLFIEDVTSFTGVDTALLDALIEEHTGKREGERLCRISSIVGTTVNYLDKNFQANHKDRITKYVYIPSDVLDEQGVYEFVGKYINTMSLTEESITEWLESQANPEDYPVHDVVEGKNWDYITIAHNKNLPLYPFNKLSINYLYRNVLNKGHQTPRYIISDIIEPIVRDAIYNKNSFPSMEIKMVNDVSLLSQKINPQISDVKTAERIMRFISVWGNGNPEQYEENGEIIISGLKKEYFEEFNLPTLSFDNVDKPSSGEPDEHPDDGGNSATGETGGSTTQPDDEPDSEFPTISQDKVQKITAANSLLMKWINDKKIDISSKVGAVGTVHAAIYDDIKNYLFSAINWQLEGISMDNARKVKSSSLLLVSLEGQSKNEGLYVMPANWNSLSVIMAFVRWRIYGNSSWNYKDSDYDVFIITSWTEIVKKEIIKKVAEYKDNTPSTYIEAAIAGEMYRMILAGEFREKNLKNFSTQVLLTSKPNKATSNSHSREWNSLLSRLATKGRDQANQDTVRSYFCIEQGSGSNVKVLNAKLLAQTFGRVKRNRLTFEDDEKQLDDRIAQRKEVFVYLEDIENGLSSVAQEELKLGNELIQKLYDAFGDDDIGDDEISEFISRIQKFYSEANKAQVNVREISLDGLKNIATMSKAINDISNVLDDDDPLSIIMAFSSDPLTVLKPLVDTIEAIEIEVNKANMQIKAKEDALKTSMDFSDDENRYAEEINCINTCKEKIGRMV